MSKHKITHNNCGEELLMLYVEGIIHPITDEMYCPKHGIVSNEEWEINHDKNI